MGRDGIHRVMRAILRTRRAALAALGAAIGVAVLAAGCATLQEYAALRQVAFSLDHVDELRLAGIRLDGKEQYSDLRALDTAALAAGVARRDVPLDFVLHVEAENPPTNNVSARLTRFDWTLHLDGRETVAGNVGGTYVLPPGRPIDVPVDVHLDLMDFFDRGARELFDLALAVAGRGPRTADVTLEVQPTIDTSLGPMRYPRPISVTWKGSSETSR